MSKKLDHNLINKYHRPADGKPRKIDYTSGVWMSGALLFVGVMQISGPIDAILVVGVFMFLCLLFAWMTKPNRPEEIGELSVDFCKDCVRILATVDNIVEYQEKVKLSDIKEVSGYIQDGWLWVRERGILLETKQSVQFRFALNLNRSELDNFLVTWQTSLRDMNYTFGKLRKFQP